MPYVDMILQSPKTKARRIVFWSFIGICAAAALTILIVVLVERSKLPTLLTVDTGSIKVKSITVIDEQGEETPVALKQVSSSTWETRAGAGYGPWILKVNNDDNKVFWVRYFASSIEGAIPPASKREFILDVNKSGDIVISEYESSNGFGRVEVCDSSFDPAKTTESEPFWASGP